MDARNHGGGGRGKGTARRAAVARQAAVPAHDDGPRHGLARVLSKMGFASRTISAQWIRDGRVRVDGRLVRDPEFPVVQGRARIEVEDSAAAPVLIEAASRVVVALNKPRGLVTTRDDEQGRDTVYACLDDPDLPWLAPVGRLDKASEGLLLFCNDPAWAARITGPGGPSKTYHVQVDGLPDAAVLAALVAGLACDGDRLAARAATMLRHGARHAWLEIELDEGRNRQIRRLLQASGFAVLRLVRVAIGGLALGTLAKGAWRRLDAAEIAVLDPAVPEQPARDTPALATRRP
jgi:23S rRNA pseudouridine2605 synthase